MEALSPKLQATPEKPGRQRGRKPGKPLTARELASRRANLEKARAVSKRSGKESPPHQVITSKTSRRA